MKRASFLKSITLALTSLFIPKVTKELEFRSAKFGKGLRIGDDLHLLDDMIEASIETHPLNRVVLVSKPMYKILEKNLGKEFVQRNIGVLHPIAKIG